MAQGNTVKSFFTGNPGKKIITGISASLFNTEPLLFRKLCYIFCFNDQGNVVFPGKFTDKGFIGQGVAAPEHVVQMGQAYTDVQIFF